MITRLSKSSVLLKIQKSRSFLFGNNLFATSFVVITHNTTPFVTAYPWSSGFGTKYANPATLPAGTGNGVAFSPSGNDVVIAHNTTPFVTAYPWSSGFGTKYANPTTLPAGTGRGVAFL